MVDTVALPQNNPWGSWIRPGGIDFFSDGRAAICTWNGDVWVSSVLDASLQHVTWRRFASGLYQPLGITVYKNSVYVNGRDQITRLHDLNGDGEADFYENFNNTALTVRNYHAFAFDLKVDARGFFYYSRNGHRVASELPDHGSVIRVAPDGLSHEVFAYGFRAPNGISLSPDGEITTGDNEGHWTPACKINLVRRGGFYGYSRHMPPGHKDSGKFDQPICWLPQNVDSSSGGQFWVTSRRWGPFTGRLLHTSYGEASLFLVMKENVRGQTQGGVVRFPLSFDSGIMRGAFGPHDGQLYVCGLKGWQTKGPKPGALQRVRFTGKPVHLPTALKVTRDGVKISFTCALDRASATDPDNYAVEHWNYRRSKKYGSKHYSVKDPKKQGHDKVAVTRATLLPDRRTVRLKLSGIRPVMQMMIKYRIQSADGAELSQEIYNTIHRLGTN